MNIATLNPSAFCEALPKSRQALLGFWIILGKGDQRADASHPLALLRAGGERPCGSPAAEQRDELASLYVEHGLLPGTRCASLQQAQDAPEAPAGHWGRPESF
jgi:hypothetical protein